MNELEIKKGDKLLLKTIYGKTIGFVTINNIYVSIVNQSRVFEIIDINQLRYLVYPSQLFKIVT